VADDGTRLSAVHRPGPADLAVVVVHGFSGSWRQPRVTRVLDTLAAYASVVALDQRGHGRSGGRSTLGHKEILDVDAAVRWARVLGYPRVASLGFSMGGSVVIRHGALHRGVDAVVSVSGPAFWYYRGTPVMRRLHWAVESPLGRGIVRAGMRTRLDRPPWPDPPPMPPVEAAELLAPTPLLVVHGDVDRYFPVEHATALHAAAVRGSGASGDAPAQLWVERGFGHAEAAVSDTLLVRIGAWLRAATGADGEAVT
jgi:pimeloyl-ACP methyl ester carboxylesterase